MIFIVSPTFEDQREMHFFFFIAKHNNTKELGTVQFSFLFMCIS
mgnify:CR=1 FL=1